MKTRLSFLRRLALTGAAALLLTAGASPARAVFALTLSQVGNDVMLTGSGTINLAGLGSVSTGAFNGIIVPSNAVLYGGPAPNTNFDYYLGLSGPASFGTGGLTIASSGSGSRVGFNNSSHTVIVPQGYVSGTALTTTSTYNNATFASLGFTPGTYTFALSNGDSLIVTSLVPEPSTWALLGVGVAGAGVVALRRRASAAARA